ncbi:MAG TPA: NAD-dependent epimerase/dehydratase family protein [Bdellovibrionota bacterium]|nr:NAD-dependent epimerase/dehydratase family protein [Bdellovibrionota bacterium]
MSRYVVTGGAGFIGSHLVERLWSNGHEVVAIDNLMTGRIANLDGLRGKTRYQFVEADVSDRFPDVGKADGVFHMASPASPKDFVPLAIPILRVGSLGTMHALEYSLKQGSWFLLASTSEVYGDPEVHPQREDYFGNVNPIGVRGVYDESKRFAEALTMAYHRNKKVSTSIVRIFNTYGPRMRLNDGRVIPNFISQALHGEPLTIYGDGLQTRSLCYVDDLVDGIVRFADKRPVEPINLGNDHEMTVKLLAETIVHLTQSRSSYSFTPLPEDDPKQRCPVLTRAQKTLGWSPSTKLEVGLQKTIDYFRKIL